MVAVGGTDVSVAAGAEVLVAAGAAGAEVLVAAGAAGADVLVAAGAAGAEVLVAAGATGTDVAVDVALLVQDARTKLKMHTSVMNFVKLLFISFSSSGNYVEQGDCLRFRLQIYSKIHMRHLLFIQMMEQTLDMLYCVGWDLSGQ